MDGQTARRIGRTMAAALQETADRVGTAEFQFFVITLAIQRETGGNLAETLSNLADVLRKRAQMKLKIRAMSSESKASAIIVGALPFIVFHYPPLYYLVTRAVHLVLGDWLMAGRFVSEASTVLLAPLVAGLVLAGTRRPVSGAQVAAAAAAGLLVLCLHAVRNWGWPNQINFFSSADPQFGLGNNTLAGGAYTGNQARRGATQPAQAIIGQAPIFNYLEDNAGHLFREGNVVKETIDAEFVPGISLATVDISADGIDFSTNPAFGDVNNFFVAGFGNLEFPLGSAPEGMIGRDIRRYRVVTTADNSYVGTGQTDCAKNTVQPGGQPNSNTGGFLGPRDLRFDPSGQTLWLVDFGGYMTIDPPGDSLTLSGRAACPQPVGPLGRDDLRRVYYYSVFPNLFLTLLPDYAMWHTLWPVATDRTRVVWSESPINPTLRGVDIRHASETRRISTQRRVGLIGDSNQTTRVRSVNTRSRWASSSSEMKRGAMPRFASMSCSRCSVPP